MSDLKRKASDPVKEQDPKKRKQEEEEDDEEENPDVTFEV